MERQQHRGPPERTTSRLSIPATGYPSLSNGRSRSGSLIPSANSPSVSPLASRSYSRISSPPSLLPHSQPHTPLESPQVSSSYVPLAGNARRLLMPTVRSTRSTPSPRLQHYKGSPSKMARSRAGSVSAFPPPDQNDRVSSASTPEWIGGGCRFEIVEDQIELEGYQIYAVEKWVVERRRPVIVLTVFTGDPKHKIIVTALSPRSTLNQVEAYVEWEKATRLLRADGARPKEIAKGTLFVTSLANFRSDYTIVHIPRGNFLDVREQLYTNINLLRMGCSGRSALTLEEPSDTTKDRFILMYHVPDKSRSGTSFNATVLELVKLIQAALAIFDMFDLSSEERNGLLCDVTSEGIKRWVTEIGEPCMKVEHMERVADPTVVAALFSLILTIRNKLHALGHYVPKDPFLYPQGFTRALTSYHTSKPHGQYNTHHLVPPRSSSPPGPSTSPNLAAAAGPSPSTSPIPPIAYLSQQLVESIQSAYDKKARQNESYKVHRVLKSKLDDLASDLRTSSVTSAGDVEVGGSGTASSINPTGDLGAFVKVVAGSSKDAPQSLRYLWTGRPEEVGKKRREKEAVWSDAERDREERERDKDGDREGWGKDGRERHGKDRDEKGGDREREVRSSGDESESKPWSGRMQRKIESWAAIGRTKKLSVDFGALGKTLPNRGGQSEQSGPPSTVPSVRVTGEQDEPLSSGQTSPTFDSFPHGMLGVGTFTPAQRSASELLEYDRRISEFNKKRPSTRPHLQSRILSWSDPLSARELVDDEGYRERAPTPTTIPKAAESVGEEEVDGMATDTELESTRRRQLIAFGPRRCRSFDATADLKDTRVLPIERMRIDVELCGQLLVMRRRERHLENVVACLSVLTDRISRTNTRLRTDHEAARPALDDLRERVQVLQQVEAARTRADALTQGTHALAYESAQFLVDDLWRMAAQPRRRVLAMREKAFGTGRRHPQGVRGAHGRFTRVQWTLDGQERLVDALGRTESEVEEEDGLPGEASLSLEEDREEMDVVENQTLRPTWLLRFFNYWGSKWGASKGADKQKESVEAVEDDLKESSPESGSSTSLPTSPVQARERPPARHTTSS